MGSGQLITRPDKARRFGGRGTAAWPALAIAAVCVLAVAVKVAVALTYAGPVNVTANMGPLSPNPVRVNEPATSSLSANYTPPSGISEGDLSAQYDWSVQVQYKALQADPFGSPPSGSYTDSINPTQPSTTASATLTFTPKIAGYWQVSASCGVTVTDTKTNKYWSGSANAGPEDLTSAMVSFSPSPIPTGADKNNPGAVYTPVTATVSPRDLVGSVTVDTYVQLGGGTGNAETEHSVPDAAGGVIDLDVAGTAGTAPSMPNGDVKLEAKDGGTVLGTDMVIVQIPKAIGTPHPTFSGKVTPINAALDAATVPAYFSPLLAGDVELVTEAITPLKVKVDDQFGNTLGSEYNGQTVFENEKSINVEIEDGQYMDAVGVFVANSPTPSGSAKERQWLAGNPATIPNLSFTQNIPVEVAGFTLNPGVVNRGVKYNNGTLTVTWP